MEPWASCPQELTHSNTIRSPEHYQFTAEGRKQGSLCRLGDRNRRADVSPSARLRHLRGNVVAPELFFEDAGALAADSGRRLIDLVADLPQSDQDRLCKLGCLLAGAPEDVAKLVENQVSELVRNSSQGLSDCQDAIDGIIEGLRLSRDALNSGIRVDRIVSS